MNVARSKNIENMSFAELDARDRPAVRNAPRGRAQQCWAACVARRAPERGETLLGSMFAHCTEPNDISAVAGCWRAGRRSPADVGTASRFQLAVGSPRYYRGAATRL